jgi:aspartyl/asparaginyl beta-hydroxylase (cupin superfamily)
MRLLRFCFLNVAIGFLPLPCRPHYYYNRYDDRSTFVFAQGFGPPPSTKGGKRKEKNRTTLIDTLDDKPKVNSGPSPKPFVKSEQEDLIAKLAAHASNTCIGQAVASGPLHGTPDADPFWELMPSLIASKFPKSDEQLGRVAGLIRHMLNSELPLEEEIIKNQWRPESEMHAYMPGLGETKPFWDPQQLELCKLLSENYETIVQEYDALLASEIDRFQSVTSMNYEAGWQTMVLFYNGHRIPDFPYHLCPTTTKLLETVPIAGRIAGFNRQQPQTGIPLHTDGNNMWLTCQLGIKVPAGAWIRVGPETRNWKEGECLLYDTTYEHETFNGHETAERVVLHVDFFNTFVMTPLEIEVVQYIYQMREEFMKAEGVAKVGAQIL